jgi:hypothetical protein
MQPAGGESCLSQDPKRQALEDALRSSIFARSEQLRRFLAFVCELEIAGRAAEITEYAIATRALGRPEDYSPGEDSAVRNRAHGLRQKLAELYASELRQAEVRIELPKGSYVPRFVENTPSPAAVDVVGLPDAEAPPPQRHSGFRLGATFALGVILGALALGGTLLVLRPASHHADPVLAEFWGPLAGPSSNALVCFASPVHLRVRQSLEMADFPRIQTPPEVYEWYRKYRTLPADGNLFVLPTVNAVPLGDALGAVTLTSVLSGFRAPYTLVSERMFSIPLLRDRNVLLIGDPEESPAARSYLKLARLTSAFDPAVREYVIRPREGAAGPTFVPKRNADGKTEEQYGLITVVSGEIATGIERRVVVFSGANSAGTQGAMEFFSSPVKLRQLKQQFAQQGHRRIPAVYQVVIRSRTDDSLLLSFDCEWHGVIGRDDSTRTAPRSASASDLPASFPP